MGRQSCVDHTHRDTLKVESSRNGVMLHIVSELVELTSP